MLYKVLKIDKGDFIDNNMTILLFFHFLNNARLFNPDYKKYLLSQ